MIVDSTLFSFFETQFLIKTFLLLFLVFYFFFSILLIRQVQIMTNSLKTDLNGVLKLASFLNFALSAVILIIAIFS